MPGVAAPPQPTVVVARSGRTLADASSQERYLLTDHLKNDLKGRSVRGGAITLSAQAIKFCLQMGSTMILARLLTPADFGLIAMVAAFTGFVGMFKDLGLSMATLQRAEITHAQVSTLFWINVAASMLLTAIAAAMAPLVAWFYGEPRLTLITIAIAGTFVFGGLSAQHTALLRRQMRFKILATIEIAALAVGIATAVTMAFLDYFHWALVGLVAATTVANCVLVWVYCEWRPGRPMRRCGVGPMLRFGGDLTGFNVINYFTRNADNILIGAAWGAGPLGIYSKAYGLLLLPLRQINAPLSSVTIPAMSRLQDDPVALSRFYCRAIRLLAYITMPLVIVMAVLANEAVHLVLGSQWHDAAPVFTVLAIFGVIQSISTTTGWVLMALGRTRRMLKWLMIGTPAILVAFAIGLPWGPFGVAVAATTCALLLVVPNMLYAYWKTPITLGNVARAIRAPFVLSMTILGIVAPLRWSLIAQPELIRLIAVACAASAVGAASFALFPSVRQDALEVVKLVLRRN